MALLIRPEIQKALREAGIGDSTEKSKIEEKLDEAGLSLETTLDLLSNIATGGQHDSVRLRALETVLKARGLLRDQLPPPPSIQIIIQDSEAAGKINPILLPRPTPLQDSIKGEVN